ncbi:MAG: hypothetical protein V3S00_01810 [Dehalococcoidia bacterium]
METLEPPYQFFHPQVNVPFDLPVARWEVGLAQRPISDPPYSIIKPTIRFHLASPFPPGLFLAVRTSGSSETAHVSAAQLEARPYLDFTNQILIKAVLAAYSELLDLPIGEDPQRFLERLEALSPQRSRPLTLRLTRHGLGLDTIYDLEVLEA